MKQQEQIKQPFFAQFLDAQKANSPETRNNAGTKPWLDGDQTHKYPSDGDDNPPAE